MRLLAFSDLHRDLARAERLVEMSSEADAVVAAGDFASVHEGLEEAIDALSGIEVPTVLVPGNNETRDALATACERWSAATVLHGDGAQIDGVAFFGLGAGVPTTPWDWSYDLTEDEARELLGGCPADAVLVVHSPPKGHCDRSGAGDHLGSEAILDTITARQPRVALCGHIHESWGATSSVGETRVMNLGPDGAWVDV